METAENVLFIIVERRHVEIKDDKLHFNSTDQ